ncbi:hypothetical protein [Bacillus sp. S3]|uniref:hypothetical protein n=1 Tax=Bacillus sp. S3 TaxID=486398 RepID=UPI0016807661|nr:hypothetical protein [Bacillus sp. S3]
MPNQEQTNREMQKGQSAHQSGSGSRYHEEHAGKVTGYGQPDVTAEELTNKSEDRPSN